MVILGHFLPFYPLPPNPPPLIIPKIKILKIKYKKMPGDIILLYIHVYHIWRSYAIWFWNIRCDRQKLLSFWVIFCPFSPVTTRKIKILILKKKPGDITILHFCTINDNHMMYIWFLRYEAWLTKFFIILDRFLPFSPRNNPKNQTR